MKAINEAVSSYQAGTMTKNEAGAVIYERFFGGRPQQQQTAPSLCERRGGLLAVFPFSEQRRLFGYASVFQYLDYGYVSCRQSVVFVDCLFHAHFDSVYVCLLYTSPSPRDS